MGKYYKKPHKHSFRVNSDKVDYPNHKYFYGAPIKPKSRLKKKYLKYEWWNEDLLGYISFNEKYQDIKQYRTHLDWETIDDVEVSKLRKYSEIYGHNAFYYETHQIVITMKPRWRTILCLEDKEKNNDNGIIS